MKAELYDKMNGVEKYLVPDKDWKREKKDFHVVLLEFYSCYRFGVMSVGNVLKSHGFQVSYIFFKIYDRNNMNPPSEIEYHLAVNKVRELKPGMVGISTMSCFAPIAMNVVDKIRSFSIPVIMGGAHAIYNPKDCMKHADYVCVGEGELSTLQLAYALYNRGDTYNIKNLWLFKDGTLVKNGLNPLIQNMDIVPLPVFSDDDKYWIENNKLNEGEPYYTKDLHSYIFMTGRGCPFTCTYCCNSYLVKHYKNGGPILRRRTVDNVMEELSMVKSMFPKLTMISANDEVFVLNKQWLLDFCKRYKEEIDIPFHCDIHPSKVSEEAISILSDIKLKSITMGIESGNEMIRKSVYNRNTPDDMIVKCGMIFKRFKVYPNYDFIFDNPLETVEQTEDSLDLLLKLPRPFRCNMYSMQHHPSTTLTELLLSKGIIKECDVDGYSMKGMNEWTINMNLQRTDRDTLYILSVFKIFSYTFYLITPYMNFRMPLFPTWWTRLIIKNKKLFKGRVLFVLKLCDAIGVCVELFSKALSLLISGNVSRLYMKLGTSPFSSMTIKKG